MKFLTLLFACFFALPAFSDDAPVYDFFAVPQGTTYVWVSETGVVSGTLVQRDGSLQKIHIDFEDEDLTDQDIWVTRQSRLTRASKSTAVISFYPDDCTRRVGRCQSRISTTFGHSTGFTSNGSYADGVWVYIYQFDTPGFETLPQKECVIYDEHGVLLASVSISFNGSVEWQRRISDGYKESSKALLLRVRAACQLEQQFS